MHDDDGTTDASVRREFAELQARMSAALTRLEVLLAPDGERQA